MAFILVQIFSSPPTLFCMYENGPICLLDKDKNVTEIQSLAISPYIHISE